MPTFKPTRVRIAFAMALFVLGGAGILVLHEVSRMLDGVRQIAGVQMTLERLNDVVYVGRPAFGQENNTVGIFKLVSGSSEAVRTPVKLGKSSVNTIEIMNGLQPGDQVILSDTSAWDAHERIALK